MPPWRAQSGACAAEQAKDIRDQLRHQVAEQAALAVHPCSCLQAPPWPVFRVGRALAARLPLLEARLAPPHAHVLGVAGAFFNSKALHAATKLGVADALRGGPLPVSERACQGGASCSSSCALPSLHMPAKPAACQPATARYLPPAKMRVQIEQLAAAVGAQPDKLQRVLRLLANLGIFREVESGKWVRCSIGQGGCLPCALRFMGASSAVLRTLHLHCPLPRKGSHVCQHPCQSQSAAACPARAGVYANNRASGLLRSDHPLCLAPMVDFNGDDLYFGMTKVRL